MHAHRGLNINFINNFAILYFYQALIILNLLFGLHWITDGEAFVYVHSWLNGDDHARTERSVVVNQRTVVNVHAKIVSNVMRKQCADYLERVAGGEGVGGGVKVRVGVQGGEGEVGRVEGVGI